MSHKNNLDIISTTTDAGDNKEKMIYLQQSLDIHNIDITVLGKDKTWTTFKQKLYWFREYLQTVTENKIIIFTDAYDVFYAENLDTIKNTFLKMNTNMLFSTEKWFSHQVASDKEFYDKLSTSNYKYFNSGGFIGFKDNLLTFYNDLVSTLDNNNSFSKEIDESGGRIGDQKVISHFIAKNYNKYNLKLDYNCEIFYTASGDWDNIDEFIDNNMRLKETKKKPCIIHVPCKSAYEHVLKHLFKKKYNNHTIIETMTVQKNMYVNSSFIIIPLIIIIVLLIKINKETLNKNVSLLIISVITYVTILIVIYFNYLNYSRLNYDLLSWRQKLHYPTRSFLFS